MGMRRIPLEAEGDVVLLTLNNEGKLAVWADVFYMLTHGRLSCDGDNRQILDARRLDLPSSIASNSIGSKPEWTEVFPDFKITITRMPALPLAVLR